MILFFSTKPQCAPLDRDASVQRKQRGHLPFSTYHSTRLSAVRRGAL